MKPEYFYPIAVYTPARCHTKRHYVSVLISIFQFFRNKIGYKYSHVAALVHESTGSYIFESTGNTGVVKIPFDLWKLQNKCKELYYCEKVKYINDLNNVVGYDYDYLNVADRAIEIITNKQIDRDDPKKFQCTELLFYAAGKKSGYRAFPSDVVNGFLNKND